jgi:hypothetical protein
MKLQEFLEKHNACKEGADWALVTGCTTIEQIWLRDDLSFDWRIWIAIRVLDQKTLIKFSCLCVREIWHILIDQRSRSAVEITEQYVTGNNLAADNLAAASDAAWAAERALWAAARAASDAARDASDAARDASWAAASAAARAASAAARDAGDAASAVAREAAIAAARDASWAAAVKKQNAILLELAPTITPPL